MSDDVAQALEGVDEARDRRIRIGEQARGILQSEVVQATLQQIERDALEWVRSAMTPEAAFRGSALLQSAALFKAALEAGVANGESAAQAIVEEAQQIQAQQEYETNYREYLRQATAAREQYERIVREQEQGEQA